MREGVVAEKTVGHMRVNCPKPNTIIRRSRIIGL